MIGVGAAAAGAVVFSISGAPGQPGLMPGGQQVGMTQPNMFHPGQVNPQQPMIYQPDMVVPSIQHVGIQQRGGYDPQFGNYPQPMVRNCQILACS